MKFTALLAMIVFLVSCQHGGVRAPSSSDFRLHPKYESQKIGSISKQHVLIVTHATAFFDNHQTATAGIDQIVREFKEKGRPVVYLVSDQSDDGYRQWYTNDRAPSFEFFSEGGEHNLPLAANEVTIVGGFFGSTDTLNGCHALSIKDAIRMHFELSNSPLTIHVPIKATYFYDDWSGLRESLLQNGSIKTSATIKYPFASIYFLREGNEGAGDDGNEQFFAHNYFGKENKNYRRGKEVGRQDYQFRFFINDKLFEAVDNPGKRIVNIKLETR